MDRYKVAKWGGITKAITDLHSSMDRYKDGVPNLYNTLFPIYIPVWIDIKCIRCVFFNKISNYLHSSMDRYKVILNCYSIPSNMHLHSSMDRYKELHKQITLKQFSYLHSSMDRYKVIILKLVAQMQQIYIPVWIDIKYSLGY